MSKDVDAGSLTRLCVYFLLLAGVVTSLGALFSCDFMSYQPSSPTATLSPLEAPFYENRSATVGFLRFQVFDEPTGCLAYWDTDNVPEYELWSTEMEFAQSVTGVLLVLAFLTAMVVTVEYCCVQNCGWNKYIIAFLLMLCTVFQGLTFLLFQAEEFCSGGRTCQMETGAVLSIVSTALFFLTGFAVLFAPAPTSTLCGRLREETCCCPTKEEKRAKKAAAMGVRDSDAGEYQEGKLVDYEEEEGGDKEVDEEKGETSNVAMVKTFEEESSGDGETTEEVDAKASNVVPVEAGEEGEEATPTDETSTEPPPEATKFSSSLIAGSIPASSMKDDSQN